MMNQGFLNQKETIPVQNNHYDEVLNISNDDNEDVSIDQNGDHSPIKHIRSDWNELVNNKHMKGTEESNIDNSSKTAMNTFYDEQLEIHDDYDNCSIKTEDGMNNSGAKINEKMKHKLLPHCGLATTSQLDHDEKGTGRQDKERDEEEHESIFPPEIVELFSCINEYKPEVITIEPKLKCFIPPYIPAIGTVDPFLKVPRPDNIPDGLGLTVIDEPSTNQSDAAVLELQLKAQMKQQMRGNAATIASSQVRSIENASKNQHEIDKWIDSVVDIRSSRPLIRDVQYKESSKMPSLDEIKMQPFPKELQDALDVMMDESSSSRLLNPQIDLTVEEYAKIICALFDVHVVEGQLIQSLHFLFNLCIEYQKDHENNDAISVL